VGRFVSIIDNPALSHIDGFASLDSVGGFFVIRDNQTLRGCSGILFVRIGYSLQHNRHVG